MSVRYPREEREAEKRMKEEARRKGDTEYPEVLDLPRELLIRLSRADDEALTRKAEAEGLSRSAFVRRLILLAIREP